MPKTVRASRVKPAPATAPEPAVDPTAKPIIGKGSGWHETTLAEMLSLDEVDMRLIDLRLGLIYAVREIRKESGMTQAQLAKRLEVSRPRIVELESVEREPTFDSLLAAFFAVGGTTDRLCQIVRRTDKAMNR